MRDLAPPLPPPLWITRHALLTACGEGVAALATPVPWRTSERGARGALWPRKASEECPAVSPKIEQRDRACAHALLAVHRLLEGCDPGSPEHVAVVLGTALGCGAVNDAYHRSTLPPVSRPSPVLFGYTVPSAPVGEVAVAFGFRGHQLTILAGAASGLAAVAEARRTLLLGRARAAVVIASDVLSLDRVELLHQQGSPPPIEATVALLIELPDHATAHGRSAKAELLDISWEPPGASIVSPAFTHLGASGLVELACALATPEPGEQTFSVQDQGQRLRLAVRPRPPG